MAEARGKEAWARTAAILAMTANVNRDPKRTKAFAPVDFNPYELARRKKHKIKVDITVLRDVFVRKEKSE